MGKVSPNLFALDFGEFLRSLFSKCQSDIHKNQQKTEEKYERKLFIGIPSIQPYHSIYMNSTIRSSYIFAIHNMEALMSIFIDFYFYMYQSIWFAFAV